MSASTAPAVTRAALVLMLLTVAVGAYMAGWWLGREPVRVELQTVKVPVPVECREPVPARPAMPVEALRARSDPVDVDQFVQAALAELGRREGYERQLLAALNACQDPVVLER